MNPLIPVGRRSLCSHLFLVLACIQLASAAVVDVRLGFTPTPQNISINVGDTVRWSHTNQEPNTISDFGNTWIPLLLPPSGSVSHTFTKSGIFGYRTKDHSTSLTKERTIGSITVRDNPTAVRAPIILAAPVEGQVFRIPKEEEPVVFAAGVDASGRSLERGEFYSSNVLIGTARVAPFEVNVVNLSEGSHLGFARVIYANGQTADSENVPFRIKPVNDPEFFNFVRVLSSGEMLFNIIPPYGLRNTIFSSTNLVEWQSFESLFYPKTIIVPTGAIGTRRYFKAEQSVP